MHLYLLQPGGEHSLAPTVALHPWVAHFNNSAVAAMGSDHSHLCPHWKMRQIMYGQKRSDILKSWVSQ